VDLRTTSGFSALHYASYWGNGQVVWALLTAGADVTWPTANTSTMGPSELVACAGSTPLHLAAANGHRYVTAMMLQAHVRMVVENGQYYNCWMGSCDFEPAALPVSCVAAWKLAGLVLLSQISLQCSESCRLHRPDLAMHQMPGWQAAMSQSSFPEAGQFIMLNVLRSAVLLSVLPLLAAARFCSGPPCAASCRLHDCLIPAIRWQFRLPGKAFQAWTPEQ